MIEASRRSLESQTILVLARRAKNIAAEGVTPRVYGKGLRMNKFASLEALGVSESSSSGGPKRRLGGDGDLPIKKGEMGNANRRFI